MKISGLRLQNFAVLLNHHCSICYRKLLDIFEHGHHDSRGSHGEMAHLSTEAASLK